MSRLEKRHIVGLVGGAALTLLAPFAARSFQYEVTGGSLPIPIVGAAGEDSGIPEYPDHVVELDPAIYDEPYRPIHMEQAFNFLHSPDVQCNLTQVEVAVIDSGINPDHEEFEGVELGEFVDFVDPENKTPIDPLKHGSSIVSIITGARNYAGSLGLAYEYSKVHSLRVLDENSGGSVLAVTDALRWAIAHNVKVINMSLSAGYAPDVWKELFALAEQQNISIVVSTGTSDSDTPRYPASLPEAFAIGATDESATMRRTDSTYGEQLIRFFMAPGDGLVTPAGEGYGIFNGTSAGAGYITEIITAMKAINPNLTNPQVFDILKASATDLGDPGFDKYTGYGVVDALKALLVTYEITWTGKDTPLCQSYYNHLPIVAQNAVLGQAQ